jgi:RimJ/RimL family protein N-acetyltransferase
MIKLERFDKSAYADLISWVDSEELLMQFAGPSLSFPLTAEQLDKSLEDKNRYAFTIVDIDTKEKIGHCEIYLMENSAKLGRILIGKEQYRGKGVGEQIVKKLTEFAQRYMDRKEIELYVFDWNIAAIKCYEKCGFKIRPEKILERKIKGETWIAVNMLFDENAL